MVNSLVDPHQNHKTEEHMHDDVQSDNVYKCRKSAMNILFNILISCIEDQQEIDNLYDCFLKH